MLDNPLPHRRCGIAYNPPGSKATFASAVYAPLIAGFGAENGNPGNFMGQQVALERITYLSPTMAYQVSDELSIGGGVGMSYQAIGLKSDLRFPNELIGMLRMIDEVVCTPFKENSDIITDILLLGMCNTEEGMNPFGKFGQMRIGFRADRLSPSYNLGVFGKPREDFSFGMVYQSAAKMRLKGRYRIENAKAPQEMIKGLMSSPTGQILAAILGFPNAVPAS